MSKEQLGPDEVITEHDAGTITLGREAAIPVKKTLGRLLIAKNSEPRYMAWLLAAEERSGSGPVVYEYDDATGQVRTNATGAIIAAELLQRADLNEEDRDFYVAVADELSDGVRLLRMPTDIYKSIILGPEADPLDQNAPHKKDTWGL